MIRFCFRFFTLSLICLIATSAAPEAQAARTGVLLLAHGGSKAWDDNVHAIAMEVDRTIATKVALGMATRANIQSAVDRLEARGVAAMVAVPLFVSSHSSVITATEYLLGLRREMPEALKTFAKMSHGAADHGDHEQPAEDGTLPVRLRVPIRMTPALDAHPLVASIVTSRAMEISAAAANEAVVLVAHGPTADEVNERWLVNLRKVAMTVRAQAPFASIDALTVRDDAPAPVRDAATRELRALVEKRRAEGRRVLIVPVLLSYGGIEQGIRTRLDGLDYTMATKALAPDPRLVEWVRAMTLMDPPQFLAPNVHW
jgi:sirohydrochlorin cobaltochelatase